MDKDQITKFIKKLMEKTESNEIVWNELSIQEISQILRKVSGYSSIVGAYETFNQNQRKSSVIGKFKVRVYYEEDAFTNEEYVFLAITDPSDYTNSIVFTEDELSLTDIEKITKLYRSVELKVSNVSSIIDDWFDD